ncbi:MAG: peptidoglycan editing factor PgeF [Prevotella sp.]|nr:peptidoglycan editing factor PgeF [Prevotella sp.]
MTQPLLTHYRLGTGVVAFSSTRHGGYSQGHYAAFNINNYCGDDPAAIQKNREALCHLLGIEDKRLLMPHQVHRAEVAYINTSFLDLTPEEQKGKLEGIDAVMTNVPGVCIGVSTADCIPILLYDQQKRVVAAVHAGWRGTVQRIAKKAVEVMKATYGSSPSDLLAQIGPGISLKSFEVGQEVYDAFAAEGFSMEPISCLMPSSQGVGNGEKWHIDLPACNCQQLLEAGLRSEQIHTLHVCTYEQHADYFSARRLGIHSGRIFTGIMLK